MSITPNARDVEYDDAYVIEEKTLKYIEDIDEDDVMSDMNDNLSLDSLGLSDDDEINVITKDYDKLKIASEISKRKIDNQNEKKIRLTEFKPKIVKREEVVEDFIRNFFTKYSLSKTIDEFNKEYNELSKKGKFNDNYLGPITDVHIKNAKLQEKLNRMTTNLENAKKEAEEAKSKWESLRKERDFHKENYVKTVNEKNLIAKDIKTLNKLHEDFHSKISDLKLKYEHLCKSKSLMKLETEKLNREKEHKLSEISRLQSELEKMDLKLKKDIENNDVKPKVLQPVTKPGEKTPWPKDIRNNIYLLQNYSSMNLNPQVSKNIRAHEKPVSCISVHIKKHVIATGGDDSMFKIYNMMNCEELASGIGHTDYISGIDIHPKGLYLATCSGDKTVKLWDLQNIKCKATFYDHHSVVWSAKFHDTGDFLLTSAEDSSIKLFDLNSLKFRSLYQGHTDSVNKINFQPFTNYFASCSADKSISIWDMRLGLTVQTFYGHLSSINDVVFNSRGDMLYSCDSDGIIKSWDIRKVSELDTWNHYGRMVTSANCIDVDKSNSLLYVGYENGRLGMINLNNPQIKEPIKAHDGSINAMGINLTNTNLYTVGSDGILNIWQ